MLSMTHLCVLGSGVLMVGIPLLRSDQGVSQDTDLLWPATSCPVSCDDMWDGISYIQGWRRWTKRTHVPSDMCVTSAKKKPFSFCSSGRSSTCCKPKPTPHPWPNLIVLEKEKCFILQKKPMMQCCDHVGYQRVTSEGMTHGRTHVAAQPVYFFIVMMLIL